MAVPSRTWLVKLAVAKKVIFALLLLITSGVTGFTWRHDDTVTLWAQAHVAQAEFQLVKVVLNFLSQAPVTELKLIARGTGVYGVIIGVAAWGVWQGKVWAYYLFAGLVGMLLPVEVWELKRELSWETGLLFLVNLIIFGYFAWEAWHLSPFRQAVLGSVTSDTRS